MNERILGYVRVSTKEQNLDRQLTAMREFGVPEKQIYREKISGKDFERPVYQCLLKTIKPGDTLLVLGDEEHGIAIPRKNTLSHLFDVAFPPEEEDK